jgi:Cof subfamily protein (haloacid dehalogenase superfamily)
MILPPVGDVGLVVSDIDGTLVNREKRLTPATIAAVGRLRAAGIRFTIISARPRSGLLPIVEALALEEPLAAFNGGTIFRPDGAVLCQHRVDPAILHAVDRLIGDALVDRWVFADDRWYATTEHGTHVASERKAANQEPTIVGDITTLYDRADKLTLVSDRSDVLTDILARAAMLSGATIALSQPYYLDVTARAANKGDGIAELAAAIGIPLSGVLAIGDQANDLPMFARAGTSVAMGQAPGPVREAATATTASNDDDGVAAVIGALLGSG